MIEPPAAGAWGPWLVVTARCSDTSPRRRLIPGGMMPVEERYELLMTVTVKTEELRFRKRWPFSHPPGDGTFLRLPWPGCDVSIPLKVLKVEYDPESVIATARIERVIAKCDMQGQPFNVDAVREFFKSKHWWEEVADGL